MDLFIREAILHTIHRQIAKMTIFIRITQNLPVLIHYNKQIIFIEIDKCDFEFMYEN